jgi:metallo-beta-lactamase family protein
MKIQFLGAAREVTGSKHLITTNNGLRILLDCGIFQGKGLETDHLNRTLGFDPKTIDYLLLSHAHVDHAGLIPYLYKNGFRGTIVSTHATRDLCSIMLTDSGHIQEHDTKTFNKKRAKRGQEPVEAIYNKVDAEQSLELFVSVPYNKVFHINEAVSVRFTNTGHMLGSSVVNLEIKENGKVKRIAYTGDIGRPVNRILRKPQPFPQADILITESTYGNRLHEKQEYADDKLLDVIIRTCVDKGGKLIIPSFSVGRTQEVVYLLNSFFNKGLLPKVDVFVDSPLSVNATSIFRLHPECFNEEIRKVMETDPDPFGFNSLFYIQNKEDSKALNNINRPCIIISSSGMMEAGRVKHHLANSISNPQNTVLALGYCSPKTLGARLLRGEKDVSIFGQHYEVKADIERIESYSGHADYSELMQFLSCQDKTKVQRMFIVHGDFTAQETYREKLLADGYKNIEIPAQGEEFEL